MASSIDSTNKTIQDKWNYFLRTDPMRKAFWKFNENGLGFIENRVKPYYPGEFHSHIPFRQIYHEIHTCFVASAMTLLEVALSYIPEHEMTNDENKLFKLLNFVRYGLKVEQTIFLVNMQCIIFNPTLGMNRRNKYFLLNNVPMVSSFNPKWTLGELIQYNTNAIKSAYDENIQSKIDEINIEFSN